MQRSIRIVFILFLMTLSGCEYVDDLPLASRFIAKNICIGLFVEGFDEQPLVDDYVTPFVPVINKTWRVNIDRDAQTVEVTNSLFKKLHARAIHRPPIGCVSPLDKTDAQLRAEAPLPVTKKQLDPHTPWPFGSGGMLAEPVAGVDYNKLQAVSDEVFTDTGGLNPVAFLVVYNGQLIHERYEGGIGPFSPLKGFSMSKSLINGLMGRLQDAGELYVTDTTGIAEWQRDGRANITMENLMQMSSGLDYFERAMGTGNDQGLLAYGDLPASTYAVQLPLMTEPGSNFNYSSGDNMIAAKVIQDHLGGVQQAYEFYQKEFFFRFDAVNSLVEHDEAGYMSSAESLFMSARDWARLAQLYMNRGWWNGEQVLSEAWVDYSLTPSDHYLVYAKNIWVNTDRYGFPMLPEDTFSFAGALERFVIAVPSRKAIVVRIGFSHNRDAFDINPVVAAVLEALPPAATAPAVAAVATAEARTE